MGKPKTILLDVLFPRVRAEILRVLFGIPSQQRYVRELMHMTGFTLRTVQDELRKLSRVGLIISWSNGYRRFYRANPGHPLFAEMLRIVALNKPRSPMRQVSFQRPERLSRVPRKQRGDRRPRYVRDRPIHWGIFSSRSKT